MNRFRQMFSRSGSNDDGGVSDAPGSSLLAIKRQRAATGCELRANVYRHAERRFLATSIMSVPGSIIMETGEPSILPIEASDEDIGRTICEHLLRHDARLPPNQRDAKLRDWAVFQASGERSVSGFEDKSSRVTIETVNLVLSLEATPVRSLHPAICVKGVARPHHAELGAMVRKTLQASDALRKAAII